MTHFELLKHIHVLLALTSGLGFALRGHVRIVLDHPLDGAIMRIAPHVVDTFLLVSGIMLWIVAGWPFLSWLGLKLGLIVLYILTAGLAIRSGHGPRGIICYLVALVLFLAIAAIALYKPL